MTEEIIRFEEDFFRKDAVNGVRAYFDDRNGIIGRYVIMVISGSCCNLYRFSSKKVRDTKLKELISDLGWEVKGE